MATYSLHAFGVWNSSTMLRIEAVAVAAVAGVAAVPPPIGVIGDVEPLVLQHQRDRIRGPVSYSITCQVDVEHNSH